MVFFCLILYIEYDFCHKKYSSMDSIHYYSTLIIRISTYSYKFDKMATSTGQSSSGQFDHLSSGRLDIGKIRQVATYRIEKCLSGLHGSKVWS